MSLRSVRCFEFLEILEDQSIEIRVRLPGLAANDLFVDTSLVWDPSRPALLDFGSHMLIASDWLIIHQSCCHQNLDAMANAVDPFPLGMEVLRDPDERGVVP